MSHMENFFMKKIQKRSEIQTYIKQYNVKQYFSEKYFDSFELLEYAPSETICQQGQFLNGLYFFLTGKIKIIRILSNGKELILNSHETPCPIGEIEFLLDKPIVSSVVTQKTSLLLYLPSKDRKKELLNDPNFLYAIAHTLASEIYQLDLNNPVNIVYSVKERLATYILSVEKNGIFTLNLTMLADSLGTSYRHLLRVINQFINDGIIDRQHRTYYILDFDKLLEYVVDNE